ncbi:MAG TPA: hypothetical protein VG053_09125 [Solirubrobacteraceae bacterium]|jgi:hypothetical protein|nr:hypothetical protein [Solirubrobacteraceae bacterium]
MRKSTKGLVTPAFVISLVALILAAGGTSFASVPVAFVAKTLGLNGKQKTQVKSIADKEIKSKAPKLSVLFAKTAGSAASAGSAVTAGSATNATNATNAANAANAANATNAGNANTVGGQTVTHFFLKQPTQAGNPTVTLLNVDGLTLTGSCDSFGEPVLTANGSSEAEFNSFGNGDTDVNKVVDGFSSTVTLLPGGSGRNSEGNATAAYATPGGAVVTVNYGFDYTTSFDEFKGCGIWGTAISS